MRLVGGRTRIAKGRRSRGSDDALIGSQARRDALAARGGQASCAHPRALPFGRRRGRDDVRRHRLWEVEARAGE